VSSSKDKSKGKKKASNNRPKHNHSKIATDLMKEWFYANMHHPFPSDELKAQFADRTGNPIATARYCRIAVGACVLCVAVSSSTSKFTAQPVVELPTSV